MFRSKKNDPLQSALNAGPISPDAPKQVVQGGGSTTPAGAAIGPSAGPVAGFGDKLGVKSLYDTSKQTPEQRAAMARDTEAHRAKDDAGTKADWDYLSANGGNWGSRQQYQPSAPPSAGNYGGVLVGGSDMTPGKSFHDLTEPGGMPGTPGNPNTGFAGGLAQHIQQGLAAGNDMSWAKEPGATATPGPTGIPPRPPTTTSLMEGDPAKLNNAAHMAKSPKYQFLSNVTGYGRGEEGALLDKLKTDYGSHWNGWEFDGRGNFLFKGDKSTLHPDWKGVTSVDAFGGYNGGGDLKARWGAGERDNSGPGYANGAALNPDAIFANPSVSPSDIPQDAEGASSILQQILAQLSDPSMKKALRY